MVHPGFRPPLGGCPVDECGFFPFLFSPPLPLTSSAFWPNTAFKPKIRSPPWTGGTPLSILLPSGNHCTWGQRQADVNPYTYLAFLARSWPVPAGGPMSGLWPGTPVNDTGVGLHLGGALGRVALRSMVRPLATNTTGEVTNTALCWATNTGSCPQIRVPTHKYCCWPPRAHPGHRAPMDVCCPQGRSDVLTAPLAIWGVSPMVGRPRSLSH